MPLPAILQRRRPLYVALSVLMVGLFLLFYLVLASFQYRQGSQRMLATANDSARLMVRHTEEVVRGLLKPAGTAVSVLAAAELPASVDLSVQARWLRVLHAVLSQNPEADAVFVAHPDGSFVLLRPVDREVARRVFTPPADARWQLQQLDRRAAVPVGWLSHFDAALKPLEQRPLADVDFDPRQRVWYREALNAEGGALIRTSPYVYFATHEVGLTLARRLPDAGGVVGIDVGVATLSTLLQRESTLPSSEAAIIDAAGRVLAYRDASRLLRPGAAGQPPELKTLDELGVPVLAALQRRWRDDPSSLVSAGEAGARQVPIEVADRHWHVRHEPVAQGSRGEPLYLAMAAPEDELLSVAYRQRRISILVSLALVLLMVPVLLRVSRAVSRPLHFLAKDAQAIGRFEFAGPDHPGSSILEVDEMARAMRDMKHTLRRFLDISSALSSETQFDRLLGRVLNETIGVSGADSGVIRLVSRDGRQLEAAAGMLAGVAMPPGGFPALPLDLENGTSAARVAAREDRTVITEKRRDVPDEQRFYADSFERLQVDRLLVLALPLKNRKQVLIGTLELGFGERPGAGLRQIEPARVAFIEALSGTAAVAIDNQRLLLEQKALLESLIELVAGAIDAKSPYTGGHCQRVPELTKMLARAACEQTSGPFADYQLSEEQWEEIHIAGWLHDCGKLTTPEYVVDKATKLETLYDRIHEVRTRFEVLKRDAEIRLCRERLAEARVDTTALDALLADQHRRLDEDYHFLARCNEGGEFLDPASIERLQQIGARTWQRTLDDRIGISYEERQRKEVTPAPALPVTETVLADKPEHRFERPERERFDADNPWGFRLDTPELLYNRGELYNLGVQRGTLTAEERYKINDHMVQTIKMLAQLPFPRHLQAVPEIAGGHHEKMDGTGYPKRLTREQLSESARMVAVADVFEALTAADRPYKRGKTLTESLQIMAGMCKGRHIDAEVFELFLRSGVFLDYARRFLRPEQIDEVDIARYLPAPGPS